jgi:hypothetical protein
MASSTKQGIRARLSGSRKPLRTGEGNWISLSIESKLSVGGDGWDGRILTLWFGSLNGIITSWVDLAQYCFYSNLSQQIAPCTIRALARSALIWVQLTHRFFRLLSTFSSTVPISHSQIYPNSCPNSSTEYFDSPRVSIVRGASAK